MRMLSISTAYLIIVSSVFAASPEELFKQLKDPDANVRRLAAEALGNEKSEAAINALAAALGDSEYPVRNAVIKALVQIGPNSVPALVGAMGAQKDGIRMDAVRALYQLGPKANKALPALVKALKDKDPDVRIHAAAAIGKMGADAKEALSALFDATGDTSNLGRGVRLGLSSSVSEAAAASALAIDPQCGERLAKVALPRLIEALKSDDRAVLSTAGNTLAILGPHAKSALPALKKAQTKGGRSVVESTLYAIAAIDAEAFIKIILNEKDPASTRVLAFDVLRRSKVPSKRVVATLGAALKDSNPEIRAAAVEEIGWDIRDWKPIVPNLIKILGEQELIGRSSGLKSAGGMVSKALVRIGSASAPGLADLYMDKTKKASLRLEAMKTLSLLGRKAKKVLPVLEKGMEEEIVSIAIESACAYILAGGDIAKAQPILRRGLKSSDPAICVTTAEKVKRLSIRVRELSGDLIPLLSHTSQDVRIAAIQAISSMGTTTKPAMLRLIEIVKTGRIFERIQALDALKELGSDSAEALPVLIEQLGQPRPSRRTFEMLGHLGPKAKPAVPALIKLLKKENSNNVSEVMDVLGAIGPDAALAVPQLKLYLADKSGYTRAEATRAIGRIGLKSKDVEAALQKGMKDESLMVRIWSAFALARNSEDSKPHISKLIAYWKEDENRPRERGSNHSHFDVSGAFEFLGLEARPALDLMIKGLVDKRTRMGTQARLSRALGQLQDDVKLIVPSLIEHLEQPANEYFEQERHVTVIETLALLGPKAKEAVPILRRLTEHEEDKIVLAAIKALDKIDPQAK